jgi:Uma2 family endonuclease
LLCPEEKLGDYRQAGVRLVWVIYPEARTARVHRIDGSVSYLVEDDELCGEDVLPGFGCLLRQILPPNAGPEECARPAPTAPNGPR